MKLPDKILNVVDMFAKIPGIGEKTALRNVLQLTKWSEKELETFANVLNELGTLQNCQECGTFADDSTCGICNDVHRKKSQELCVVETITDCLAIERSGQYRGLYHILGGVLNPLLGVGPDELRLNKLAQRVKDLNVQSLVLAISPSVEGDATSSYIKGLLPEDVQVDRIGFGIPMGGNLDYLDSMTISKALENRRKM